MISDRWIDVNKRLPEPNSTVLCLSAIGIYNKGKHSIFYSPCVCDYKPKLDEMDREMLDEEPGFMVYDSEYGYYNKLNIKYWLPIPDYKE